MNTGDSSVVSNAVVVLKIQPCKRYLVVYVLCLLAQQLEQASKSEMVDA
jgi:hypothetical protein